MLFMVKYSIIVCLHILNKACFDKVLLETACKDSLMLCFYTCHKKSNRLPYTCSEVTNLFLIKSTPIVNSFPLITATSAVK